MQNVQGQEIFQVVKYLKLWRQDSTPILTYNKTTTTTFEEKSNMLYNVMFPPPSSYLLTLTQIPLQSISWAQVTAAEVEIAIMTSASNKTLGYDGISF